MLSVPWAGHVLPCLVLGCPVHALAGRWKGGMFWGVYLRGTRAVSSLQIHFLGSLTMRGRGRGHYGICAKSCTARALDVSTT